MRIAFILLIITASAAAAKEVPIILNDQNQQTMVQALDALWKARGLYALDDGTAAAIQDLYQKLKAAASDKQVPSEPKP